MVAVHLQINLIHVWLSIRMTNLIAGHKPNWTKKIAENHIPIIFLLFKWFGKPSRGGLEVERSLHKRRDSASVGSNPV